MSEVSRLPPVPIYALLFGLLLLGSSLARADDPFQDQVVPFLKTYCTQCHNPIKSSGDLDLTRFTSPAKLVDDFRQWEHVVDFLKKEEMPPAKAKQPAAELRAEMIATMEKVVLAEALKLAGEPGPVTPRRLSNAEYDYTIRDITGADIRPARSFPVDPASGEGFNNTGEALTMSPSLFKKYYAAGELVADHALLTTSGLSFAPHPVITFADRQKFYEQAIIRFYESRAVDYETYFTALWLFKHRPAAKKAATVEDWAAERGLSPKYSRLLWDTLTRETADQFVILWLQQWWSKLPAPKNPAAPDAREVQAGAHALAGNVAKLSRQLCPIETPAFVATLANAPIDHLGRRRQTAATRDTFAKNLAGKIPIEFKYVKNAPNDPPIKLTIQVEDLGPQSNSYVIIDASFATKSPTTDGSKKWSLRAFLEAHAPDQLAKFAFGKHPLGGQLDADSFALKAPALLELDIPRAFPFKDKGDVTFTAECRLADLTAGVSVRLFDRAANLLPFIPAGANPTFVASPVVDPKQSAGFEASASAFCRVFPSRFFYVDPSRGLTAGFHLIEGYFRDDQPLCRLVLSDADNRELDQLWTELYFATGIWEKMLRGFAYFERSARQPGARHTDFDAFKEEDPDLVKDEMLLRFRDAYLKRARVNATGEALARHPISIFFADVRNGLKWQSDMMKRAEPIYLKDLLAFAEKAYRRPLTDAERRKLEQSYTDICRDPELGIDAAVRATIVRILASPHFCMRLAPIPAGESVAPIPDLALASRLSYFIWSGPPDDALLALAKAGKLRDEGVLRGQIRRMLKDPKVSRFALEFFGQWLGYRDFLTREAVNRQVFPAFDEALKTAMFEEPTRLITYLIQNDRPITDLLNGDATFVNDKLARHYGVPFRATAEWELTTGLHANGRGGVLGMAVFLTKNSQPQRTSPVKRGHWVVQSVLGEHIPPPPPDVQVLPAKETETNGKTIRQLMKMHVEDNKCAKCHQHFDSIGLAMEGFDPIGKSRAKDLAGRAIDNAVVLPNGKAIQGVPEFGDYLAKHRKADFTTTLCRKFLGYALGRSLQISDQPLLEAMQADLEKSDFKLAALFELAALSPQFRTQRCKDFSPAKFQAILPTRGEK